MEISRVLKLLLAVAYFACFIASQIYSYFGIFNISTRYSEFTSEEVNDTFWLIYIVEWIIGFFFLILFTGMPIHKKYKVINIRSGVLVSTAWIFFSSPFGLTLMSVLYDVGYPNWFRIAYAAIIIVLQFCMFLQFILLLTIRMPTLLHRIMIAWPSSIQFTSLFLSLFFVIILPIMCWLPYCSILYLFMIALSCIGLYQTTYTPKTINDWDFISIPLDFHQNYSSVSRIPVKKSKFVPENEKLIQSSDNDYLRIIQITDPHLGTMTSIARLKTICEQAVSLNPDLIFLTGDFFTIEAYNSDEQALYNSLLPLKAVADRTFACLGNHDKEHCAPEITEQTLSRLGIKLLVESSVNIETSKGHVQIVGLDFAIPLPNNLTKRVTDVCKSIPKIENSLRITLLHDPSGFSKIPPEDQTLVLSGHTHGGQIGLLSFGIPITMISLASNIPDQGLFGHAQNRLYVNRAVGCRTVLGTQLTRLFVPPEFSVLEIPAPNKINETK